MVVQLRVLVANDDCGVYGCEYVMYVSGFFFLMRRRPPRSTQGRSSAASDVYKRQAVDRDLVGSDFPKGWFALRSSQRVRIARDHRSTPVSYTHLRAHETVLDLVCRLLLEKKKNTARTTSPTTSTRHLTT